MPPIQSTDDSRWLSDEREAENIVQNFHQGVFQPEQDHVYVAGTMDVEQNRYKFIIQLDNSADYGDLDNTERCLKWDTAGQVEVTYFLDSAENKIQRCFPLEIDNNHEQKAAYFIDTHLPNLQWENFIVIGLKFGAGTIKYYTPGPNEPGRETAQTISEMRAIHFEIRDKPEAILENTYFSRGPQGYEDELASFLKPSRSLGIPLPRVPNMVLSGPFSKANASSQGMRLGCSFEWDKMNPGRKKTGPGYRIRFLDLHNGKRVIYWNVNRKVRAHVIYKTDREYFSRKRSIEIINTRENGHAIRYLKDPLIIHKRWNKFIQVSIEFDPGTIKYFRRTFSREEEIKEKHVLSFHFGFASYDIQGKRKALNRPPRE